MKWNCENILHLSQNGRYQWLLRLSNIEKHLNFCTIEWMDDLGDSTGGLENLDFSRPSIYLVVLNKVIWPDDIILIDRTKSDEFGYWKCQTFSHWSIERFPNFSSNSEKLSIQLYLMENISRDLQWRKFWKILKGLLG